MNFGISLEGSAVCRTEEAGNPSNLPPAKPIGRDALILSRRAEKSYELIRGGVSDLGNDAARNRKVREEGLFSTAVEHQLR